MTDEDLNLFLIYSSQPNTKNSKDLVKELIKMKKGFTFPDNLIYFDREQPIQIFKINKSV